MTDDPRELAPDPEDVFCSAHLEQIEDLPGADVEVVMVQAGVGVLSVLEAEGELTADPEEDPIEALAELKDAAEELPICCRHSKGAWKAVLRQSRALDVDDLLAHL